MSDDARFMSEVAGISIRQAAEWKSRAEKAEARVEELEAIVDAAREACDLWADAYSEDARFEEAMKRLNTLIHRGENQ